MNKRNWIESLTLGLLLALGIVGAALVLSDGLTRFKALERSVTVKGLSEREVMADVAIWPIKFNLASNDLNELYSSLQEKNELIVAFLLGQGFQSEDISLSSPSIVDKQAQGYGDTERARFRYSGTSTITVYSDKIDRVRQSMTRLPELGKQGIVIAGQDYGSRTEYLFTRLNDIKPAMVEEATTNAREVAAKFAQDSSSRLGKIRQASQGQFSISDRDSNTPYIKKVRVVSTIEYYLSD